MKMIGSVSCFSSLILPVFSCCAVFCVSCTSRPKQAICAGRRKKAAKGEGREGQQDLVETRRTNEMDKKAGGEADPEAMRLHITNSCLFRPKPWLHFVAGDMVPFCSTCPAPAARRPPKKSSTL